MGGRRKGSKNKHSFQVEEIAHKFDVEPFEVLMWVATGDWKKLGFDGAEKTSFTPAGIEFTEPNIRLQDRVQAAKEACKYLYSAKQAVAISTGETGIKLIIEDFTTK